MESSDGVNLLLQIPRRRKLRELSADFLNLAPCYCGSTNLRLKIRTQVGRLLLECHTCTSTETRQIRTGECQIIAIQQLVNKWNSDHVMHNCRLCGHNNPGIQSRMSGRVLKGVCPSCGAGASHKTSAAEAAASWNKLMKD